MNSKPPSWNVVGTITMSHFKFRFEVRKLFKLLQPCSFWNFKDLSLIKKKKNPHSAAFYLQAFLLINSPGKVTLCCFSLQAQHNSENLTVGTSLAVKWDVSNPGDVVRSLVK